MSMAEQRKRSERISQWEELMRKFAQSHKEECRTYSLAIPRVERSEKRFPTGSTYCGTWDVLGMSGHGTYTFPNGAIYRGQFDDGAFHGEGVLEYPSGIRLRTRWWRGELIHKTLLYSDGSEYKPDSGYCVMPDRRFTIEHDSGLQPAGKSYLTAEQPTREIPFGYYDTGDGFYSPSTKMIHKSDNIHAILRVPSEYEQKWIIENCRTSPLQPLGARKDLYEEWIEPRKSSSKPHQRNTLSIMCNCKCCKSKNP